MIEVQEENEKLAKNGKLQDVDLNDSMAYSASSRDEDMSRTQIVSELGGKIVHESQLHTRGGSQVVSGSYAMSQFDDPNAVTFAPKKAQTCSVSI